MPRFDRYLLSQLLAVFGFFALVLVGVYWINRAVVLFDQLISDGQSAWVFLEFTALTLPNVIRLVLPIAGFAASVYVANRLSSESELVVMQATGFSPFRMIRPVLYFGLVVALMMAILLHALVPTSRARLADRRGEISENVAARFLSEGAFLHPAPGITFYIRAITPQSELQDIFLSDTREHGTRTTYTAKRALLVKTETGPKLAMFDGLAQVLQTDSQRLTATHFKDFTYDIGSLIEQSSDRPRAITEIPTGNLLTMDVGNQEQLGISPADITFAVHDRTATALLGLVAAIVGFASLLVGGYSRFGLRRQIGAAILLLILVQMSVNASVNITLDNLAYWPILYAPIVIGGLISCGLLILSGRVRRPNGGSGKLGSASPQS